MDAYVIRLGSHSGEEVDELLDKDQDTITVSGIYQYAYEIQVGDVVFFYLGGVEANIYWAQGLRAVGRVSRRPYNWGYDVAHPRNYELDVEKICVLERSIAPIESKIHTRLARRLWDVPYIGARHFQNQAIGKIWNTNGVVATFELIFEFEPDAETILRGIIPQEFLP